MGRLVTNPTRRLAPLVILALAALACRALFPAKSWPAQTATPAAGWPPTAEVSPARTVVTTLEPAGARIVEATAAQEIPPSENAATQAHVEPTAEGIEPTVTPTRPSQSWSAGIQPPDRRHELTHLSGLLGFEVTGPNGERLGLVTDYVVNTCETYIIHFVMQPDEALGFASGERLIIPFEVVTINSGVLDAGSRSIRLQVNHTWFAGAPASPAGMALIPTDWEGRVRDYWKQAARVSNLNMGCKVALPGSGEMVVVHKVAYATALLEAELYDGLGDPLGRVEEAVLEPESGKLGFYIVKLTGGPEWTLVPLRAVNIPKETLELGEDIRLELLIESAVFLDSPRFESFDYAGSETALNQARQYWNR